MMDPIIRAGVYSALASIFRPAPIHTADFDPVNELKKALKNLNGNNPHKLKTIELSELGEVSSSDNSILTYNRLFVGPQPQRAHPYESVYRSPDGIVMGEATMQVVRAYTEAGLVLGDDCRELPDHIYIELEFMAYLAREEALARANEDENSAVTHLRRQMVFLRDHLTCWVPYFCNRVIEADPNGYYGQVAVFLADFIVRDVQHTTKAWLNITKSQSPTTAPDEERDVGGDWKVIFRPERKIPCTLCGICTEVCQPGALDLVKSEWEIELFFNQSKCSGCEYCAKYCPERILRVVHTDSGSDKVNQGPNQMANSSVTPCKNCGRPLISESLLTRVLERFRRQKGDPNEEATMHLCHACKVSFAARA